MTQMENSEVNLLNLIAETFGGSRSEVRRKLSQGAVKLNGSPLEPESMPAADLNGELQVGKRQRVVLVNGKTKYDSMPDTKVHINRVRSLLHQIEDELAERGNNHDASKLVEPEISIFNEYTPKLRAAAYGSPEYNEMRKSMGGALVHHYANNRHHPEHWLNGVRDMNLIDLMEMLADWKAATERMDNGNLAYSIIYNQERFGMSDELTELLYRTADELGWLS
jgi:hypothetical protein